MKYFWSPVALKSFTSLLKGVKGLFLGFLVEVRVIVGLAAGLVKIFYSSLRSFFSSSSLLSEISFSSSGRMLPVTFSSSGSSSISISFENSRHLSAYIVGSTFFGIKVYDPTENAPGYWFGDDYSEGTSLNITDFTGRSLSVNLSLISVNLAKFDSFELLDSDSYYLKPLLYYCLLIYSVKESDESSGLSFSVARSGLKLMAFLMFILLNL